MHSPLDRVVGIHNAAAIFKAALPPKSFVSLDGVDHLLNHEPDARFAADIIGTWASRYLSPTA
jgi:putative redox protein